MPITTPQLLPGIVTSCAPSAITFGNQYLVAWTNIGANPGISCALLTNSIGNVFDTPLIFPANLTTQPGFGPALANFNGTAWMAFVEGFVVKVTNLNESTWSTPTPLWDFTPVLNVPNLANAMTAAAIAATASQILVAWVEPAVVLVGNKQVLKSQVFFSTSSSPTTGSWSPRAPVTGALTATAPALVGMPDGSFYMAWQGDGDSTLWLCQYTATGWGTPAQIPDINTITNGVSFETSASPALGVDDLGNLQLAWRGKSSSNIFIAFLSTNNTWSTQFQIPGIGTSAQPALACQFSGSPDPMLMYTGATSPDLWAAPLNSVGPVLPFSGGLGGSSNYSIYSDCNPIIGLSVSVQFSEDMSFSNGI
jgi:hypothetical protein